MDLDLAKRYAELLRQKKQIEADLRAVKHDITTIEPLLLSEMRDNQMERLHLGDTTLYMHRILVTKPKGGNRRAVTDALKALGLQDLVTENYNANTLSAWVREHLASGRQLGAVLESVIDLDEVVSVRGRTNPNASESLTARAVRTLEEQHND